MVMGRKLWVARLEVSPATAEKITGRHSLEIQAIRDAVECISGLVYVWHVDPERGERAIVQIRLEEQRVLVVLYDAQDPMGDVYHLGSAYRVNH
jgi:SpoU rRNA methylase family enzyme